MHFHAATADIKRCIVKGVMRSDLGLFLEQYLANRVPRDA